MWPLAVKVTKWSQLVNNYLGLVSMVVLRSNTSTKLFFLSIFFFSHFSGFYNLRPRKVDYREHIVTYPLAIVQAVILRKICIDSSIFTTKNEFISYNLKNTPSFWGDFNSHHILLCIFSERSRPPLSHIRFLLFTKSMNIIPLRIVLK